MAYARKEAGFGNLLSKAAPALEKGAAFLRGMGSDTRVAAIPQPQTGVTAGQPIEKGAAAAQSPGMSALTNARTII